MQLSFDLSRAQARPSRASPAPRLALAAAPQPSPAPPPLEGAAALKARIARLERDSGRAPWGAVPFGDARIDGRLPLGGLQLGHWHEIGGDGLERESPAAVTGFAAGLAARVARSGMVIWALRRDDAHAPGLQSFGLDPARVIFVRVDSDADVLSVQEDALRTRGVAAVLGELEKIDLTEGRRLQLACERFGATGFVLRRTLFGTRRNAPRVQAASAATRWRIAPAHSASDQPGLGAPRLAVRLERVRGGRPGAWILETQHETASACAFTVVAELADHTSQPEHDRPARDGPGHDPRAGQRAASGGG